MTKLKADLWYYRPSFPAAVATASIFAVLLAIHSSRLFKTRTWFCTPFVIGAICEIIGFSARVYSHFYITYSTSNGGPLAALIIQSVLILLAPVLYAASVYMFFGRIMRATSHTSLSPVPIQYLTKLFVWADFICLNVQSTGASLFANANGKASLANLGKVVVLVGLVAQIFTFGFFVYVAVIWHRRVNTRGQRDVVVTEFRWERYMYMLYTVSIIITCRNLFRVAEYAIGDQGYLNTHEWPIYVFDAFLMALVLAICIPWYVGDIGHLYEESRGSIEMIVNGEYVDGSHRCEEPKRNGFDIAFDVFFLGLPWVWRNTRAGQGA